MKNLPVIDMPSYHQLPRETLDAHLEHIFRTLLPSQGCHIREPQIALAEHLLDCICRRDLTLAEAEVGTGKTHAYLIAALLAKRSRVNDSWMRGKYPEQSWADSAYMPVVISTSSIALQNAIVQDYIPELSRILMEGGVIETPLTAVLRKGKEHYLCEHRLRECFKDTDKFTKPLLAPLLEKEASFDLDDAINLTPYIKRNICVVGRCPVACRSASRCRYRRYLEQAMSGRQYDFQVCNHNYFLADLLHRRQRQAPLLPPYQAVILDEAHKFLAAARQMYGIELAASDIHSVSSDIRGFEFRKREHSAKIWRNAKKLDGQARRLFDRLRPKVPVDDEAERLPVDLQAEDTRRLRNIRRICNDLSAQLSGVRVYKRYRSRCAKTVDLLSRLQHHAAELERSGDMILWTEYPSKETASLNAIPKDLEKQLYRDLWSQGVPVVFTSGTLSAAGDFSRMRQTLGLHHLPPRRVMETHYPSPFHHRENVLLYISENVPFPDNQDRQYIAAVADEIERLIGASHGHAAILFTSYQAMDKVLAVLDTKELAFPLFRLGRGDGTAIQRFRESGNGVLFAAGTLWEGIDIPGDALSLLVIVRLPFAVPDPISEYEQTQYANLEEYKAQVVVPDMLVKLKQGFGRLVRTETDTGVVALLDARVRKGAAYREQVLAALPDCRTISDITDVKTFIHKKKTPGYFA